MPFTDGFWAMVEKENITFTTLIDRDSGVWNGTIFLDIFW